jgi:ligand-binding sensor domain-containing protein
MTGSIRILFAILFSLLLIPAFSQSPYFRKHALPLEFKNAEVHCMLQDRNRFIWLGTSYGLIRYNGTSYKHFLHFPNEPNEVSALFEDSKGVIWVGYRDGKISTMANGSFNRPHPDTTRIKETITGFAEDKNSRVWISTYGQGLFSITDSVFDSLTVGDGLSDDFIYAIAPDRDGKILAGTDVGLSIVDPSRQNDIRQLQLSAGLRDNIITAIAVYDDAVWLGSESSGIARLSNAAITYPLDKWEYGRVTAILPMGNIIWVGTAMHGIIEIDLSANHAHPIVSKGLSKKVTDLLQDKEGNIWVCNGTGVFYSGNITFAFLETTQGTNNSIQAILYSRNDIIWFSTNTGVYRRHLSNQEGSTSFSHSLLKGVQIISIEEDDDGNIWMGSFDKGVFVYDPKTSSLRQFTEADGLINNNVLSIACSQGSLWFATLGGVSEYRLNDKPGTVKFRNYTSENGLGSNYIYKVFIDSKDRVWFATDGKGITVLENGKFRNYSLSEGLKSNIIYSVTEDASGQIWISTANAGIFRWNGEQFQAFVPHNGLRDLAISSIIGDKNNNLIIVCKNGIDILDPKSGAVFYHGDEFGISEIDPNLNAFSVDPQGNIWLGTQNGIIKYNATIKPMQKWPVTTINEVQLFLSASDTTDKKLAHNENHVSFDYFGFWYHNPAEVSYKLKLQGYDREWIHSKNHFITYPNLPPGDYTFVVQSSATNHFEGALQKTFRFTVSPPFYNTLWFYGVCAVTGFGLTYWYVRRRETNLKARERLEKEKIKFQFQTLKNQVNPHFLFNSFNTLIGVIEQDKETAVEYVEKLSDFYRDILVNREKDLIPLRKELEMIQNYYFLQIKRYKKNFVLQISIDGTLGDTLVAPLTLQLLVENAIKHNVISTEKPLVVEIFQEDDCLVVRNNLQRKTISEPSTGLGLNNIINRYQLLTENKVRVAETERDFSVYIPLLKG